MSDLPIEIVEELLFAIDDLRTLNDFCKTNKNARELCRKHRVALCERLIRVYGVQFNDPKNFIYVMNNVDIKDVVKDGTPDYCRLLKLYSKFFYEKEIVCTRKNISSMPLYPNVERLICNENYLQTLPEGMKSLYHLDCSGNEFKSLPQSLKELDYLRCSQNELTSLPDDTFHKLKYLDCSSNKLVSLPKGLQELEHLNCANNSLTSLSDHKFHNLIYLDCAGNVLTSLPTDMKELQYLDCQDNRLTDVPLNMYNLEKLNARGNSFSSSFLDYRADIEAYKMYVITTLFPPPKPPTVMRRRF